jgi:uncharacterized membrane protein
MEPLLEDGRHDGTHMTAPRQLRAAVEWMERSDRLDALGSGVGLAAGAVATGRRGDALRGRWLGHALHPLLTDVPLGCWLAAGVLDVLGGSSSRRAATRLVGVGLVATAPTVASGLAEYDTIDEDRSRRVAAVHAAGNAVVSLCYLASWRARHRGHHLRGVTMGVLGGGVAIFTGYLGGHLSFARGVGTGERGMGADLDGRADPDAPTSTYGTVADVVLPVG